MDRTEDRWLVVVLGALAVMLFVYLLRSGGGPELLGTIFGGAILAVLLSLAWRFWQNEQEESLIRAFRDEANGHLSAKVAIYKAVNQARLQDPSPVLDRLLRKRHLVVCYVRDPSEVPIEDRLTDKDPVDPEYLASTYEGRERANRERPPLLQRLYKG